MLKWTQKCDQLLLSFQRVIFHAHLSCYHKIKVINTHTVLQETISVNTENWAPDNHWTGFNGMPWSTVMEHWPTAAGKTLKLTFLFQAVFQCYEVFIEYKINLRIIVVKKLLQVTSIHNIWKEEQSNYTRAERQEFQALCNLSIREWNKCNTKLF